MVALLFTAIIIIGLLVIPFLFWAVRTKGSAETLLPPPNPPRGLFSDEDGFESAVLPPAANPAELEDGRTTLIERAKAGEKSALLEAQALNDPKFYSEVLNHLTAKADHAPVLLALATYVTRNELPVNRTLAEALIRSWKNAPDRSSTATTLHLTALADDADLYQSAVEAALHFWRQGQLPNISAAELRALFDGEFWVLSARTRGSGAGFILKRKLATARRELETAMRVN